jgi:hypothetical protein
MNRYYVELIIGAGLVACWIVVLLVLYGMDHYA